MNNIISRIKIFIWDKQILIHEIKETIYQHKIDKLKREINIINGADNV